MPLTRRALLAALATPLSQQPDFRLDVDLVTLTFTATHRSGQPVEDLRVSDLTLLDNAKPTEILHLWRDLDVPLTVGLIADVSITQAAHIADHRLTIRRFLENVLAPRDRAFLVTIAADVVLVTDWTASVEELMQGVEKVDSVQSHGKRLGPECPPRRLRTAGGERLLSGCGGSNLWDGIFHSARLKLRPASGRRAMIFLSDAKDTGSVHSLSDAIEAAQSADALVYTIYHQAIGESSSPDNLQRLSAETGGRSYTVWKGDLPKVFAQIEADLRNVYVLAFRPPDAARDGAFRTLKLTARRRGLQLRARPGYRLPPP